MDGDSSQRKKYDLSAHGTAGGIGRSRPLHHSQESPINRFRDNNQPPASRGLHVDTVAHQSRNPSLHPYGGFEYAESASYNAPSLQGGPLQSGAMPYQQDFSTSSSRQNQSQATQQSGHQDQQRQQRIQQYDPGMVYNIAPQAQPHSPYDTASHYQPRHSAAIEVLATQFGVPQYYPTDESPATESTHYLTTQVQQTPYSQPHSATRSHIATSFPETMAGFNTSVAPEPPNPSERLREPSSGLEDAYNRYQQALRQTFENIRIGRLITASRSLLEMSEWLLGNAVDLGLVRDEEHLHTDRIKLWDEFNTCWLALCQKQKDTTQGMLESGPSSQEILTEEILNKMGKDLVRLCDRIEQYGLVDYQMGVWEEEILSVLSQCLDLLEEYEDTTSASRSQTGTVGR
ncbi:hypothetical protein, variant [Coccidioides immitis RS]|uniref:Uncharacterized protein n=1 Tax=Coccidioides immitis (strain RS) TaxID=246410 RepID=I9XIF5_COCIM|nr:uncharacterized protein CIMG_02703 [Coccidioides immitis RS]XP_004445614.1 hypothetical protein, variant [Coccidioides immitis RS]KJF59963.1 hypothetical protein CIMG_02703 [Coccidioides immitis RS]KJF59964.1 hypothetical protein, variant [Coccidioides immitis RS]